MIDGIEPEALYSYAEAADLLSLTLDEIRAAVADGDFTTSGPDSDLIAGRSMVDWALGGYREMRRRDYAEAEADIPFEDADGLLSEADVQMTDAEYEDHLVEQMVRDNSE